MISLMLYAIVQIIIEMVPVSSSGHVLVMQHFLAWNGWQALPMPEWYDHFLHGPTLVILMIYFSKDWLGVCTYLVRGAVRKTASWWRMARVVGRVVMYVCLADGVTACMYLTFKKWLDGVGVSLSPWAVIAGMAVTMVLLLSTLLLNNDAPKKISRGKALMLGFVQGCAFFPGVSRFGSTYVIARWLGIGHRRAFQFSFAMFVPFIIVAFAGHGVPGMLHNWDIVAAVLVPCLCATVLAYTTFDGVERLAACGKWYYLGLYMLLPLLLMMGMVLR
ncbi:MAG: undecaprenyl-diphosphate phosphatase [Candidatus Babeliales bacterium]